MNGFVNTRTGYCYLASGHDVPRVLPLHSSTAAHAKGSVKVYMDIGTVYDVTYIDMVKVQCALDSECSEV